MSGFLSGEFQHDADETNMTFGLPVQDVDGGKRDATPDTSSDYYLLNTGTNHAGDIDATGPDGSPKYKRVTCSCSGTCCC